ncbi:hypothetical protein IKG02_01500 [Candidatus Saccharibacteria bacterium]|nr:hypothetical protein [Candidatus Saccharibacteria bacterium]
MKLSEKIKTLLFAGVLVASGVGAVGLSQGAYAATDPLAEAKKGVTETGLNGGKVTDIKTLVPKVVNALLYVIGILAVIMIIFGGITYTTSAGDSAKVTKAKNIILYGIVGLIVAILAYAIVNFVLTQLGG